ncbi:hypothetical protein RRG08_055219 [Elysia crispata]|uniref:Uncharacterized protein n=1 Tax=Elysia crispata TaxID=231223 RepID=A0AAE0XSY6_9GAST|nr:hypothetical protein RRG08_055219 [Elysia crispata]
MVTLLIATFTNTLRHHQDDCKLTRFSLKKLCATAVTSNDNFEKQLLEFSETEQISPFSSHMLKDAHSVSAEILDGGRGGGGQQRFRGFDTGYNRNRFHFSGETSRLDSHEGKISMTEKSSLRLLGYNPGLKTLTVSIVSSERPEIPDGSSSVGNVGRDVTIVCDYE